MNNKFFNKLCTAIIYVLTIILIVLIVYNMFLLICTYEYEKPSPKNSIKVSPISEDESHNAFNNNEIFNVSFKDSSINTISSISDADIIYDNYSKGTMLHSYSALFLSNSFKDDKSVSSVKQISYNDLPNIYFNSEYNEDNTLDSDDIIDSILITYPNGSYSNFFYYNDSYHHFSESNEDKNSMSNEPILYQNIIVNINSSKSDCLYVFSDGVIKKYSKNSPLLLKQGKIFWASIPSDSSFTYSFNELNNKIKN